MITVISERVGIRLLFNFVNIQPEESYKKRGRNRRESKRESSKDILEGSEETTPITNIENAAENGKTAEFARKHLEVGIYQENTSRNIPQVKKRNM